MIPASCADYLADLAAFIECDTSDLQTMQRLLYLYGHLWACTACRNTYSLTKALMQIEMHTPMASQTMASRAMTFLPSQHLRLSRTLLRLALPVYETSLGVARGPEDSDTVLAEQHLAEGRVITLQIVEQPLARWSVAISVRPPLRGSLMLEMDHMTWQAELDACGDACVPDLPLSLLAAEDGPDLVIRVEPDTR